MSTQPRLRHAIDALGSHVIPNWAGDLETERLRELAYRAHPYTSLGRWLAMIHVYADLSGTDRGDVYVAAGYIGTEESWIRADERWRKILHRADVPEFHATDFYADPPRGHFKGWKLGSKRHRDIETLVTNVANAEQMIGIGYGIDPASFPAIQEILGTARAKQRIRTLRTFVAILLLERFAALVRKHPLPKGERIVAMFEREKGGGGVEAWFRWAKREGARWTVPYIDVTQREKRRRPVQIADLLAHQTWRRLLDVQRRGLDYPPQPAFARLIAPERVDVTYMNADQGRASLPALRAFLAAHPRGFVPTRKTRP